MSRTKAKNFRKRSIEVEDEDEDCESRLTLALEEVKFLQRQREKKSRIPVLPTVAQICWPAMLMIRMNYEGNIEKDDLVLQHLCPGNCCYGGGPQYACIY